MEGFKGNISSDRPIASYNDVLKKISDAQIFQFYIPDIKFNGRINSPLGDADDNPSFSVYWSTKYGKYLFKEHRYGWFGDCFDFVDRLYGYNNSKRSIMKVCADFGFTEFHIDADIESGTIGSGKLMPKLIVNKTNYTADIQITVREWTNKDLAFWYQFGITKKWLLLANIFPIKYYFIDNNLKIADEYSYAYLEDKDGHITYKIYQPFNKERKWISNNNRSVWELWEMLPDKHPYLIITKSRKDALSVMATTLLPSTSLQAEGTIPKASVIDELKLRFDNIFLLYDNDFNKKDNYGRMYGEKLSELFDLPQIEIPDKFNQKDYSDLVKAYGTYKSKFILWSIIKTNLITR